MKIAASLLSVALCSLFSPSVSAQNILITYQKSDMLFACGTDTFFVKVQNTGTATAAGATLLLSLPAGLAYLPGTVSGATQQNVSNLQQPVFGLPDIASGSTAAVALLISADCDAADALDAGQLFVADISVQSASGTVSISTANITVETGLILIESIENELMSGEKGDTLLRKICVKNTRPGKIGTLYFEDEHQPGIEISVAGAASQTSSATLFSATFSGDLFKTGGDGDGWLELGETVCLTEKVAITDCGIPEFTNPSLLRAGWGCGGEVCRYDSVLVAIEIKKSTRIPDLVFTPVWNPPTDYCGNTPAVMGLKISNIGKADATEVFVNIEVLADIIQQTGMGASSFRLVQGGVATPLPTNLATLGTLPLCGKEVARDVALVVPLINAKDSLLLLFDTHTCEASCEQVLPLFIVEYFYRKSCPPNGFVSDTLAILPDGYSAVGSFVGTDIGSCLHQGNSYVFHYEVTTNRMLDDNGFLNLKLELPHGLSFDDSCATLLGGITPGIKTVTPLPGGGSVVHLAWALPLPDDSLEMDFCLRYECDTNIVCLDDLDLPGGGVVIYSADCPASCFLQIDSRTYWTPQLNTPYECAIGDCDSLRVAVNVGGCLLTEGETGDTLLPLDTIFPLPGLRKWFDVYRLNYGLQDDNNDRHADNGAASAPASASGLRRDRFLAGDTLRVEYGGVVDSGGGLVLIGRTIWHEIVRSDMGGPADNDVFMTSSATTTFVNNSLFRFVRDSLRIRYADGSERGCLLDDLKGTDDENFFTVNQVNTWPPEVLDDLASQRFRLVFSLEQLHQAGCLPKGTLDFGDSIFIYTDFKIGLNYRPVSSNKFDPPLVGFRSALADGGLAYAYNSKPFRKLQYSGIRTTRSANQHSIRACENSLEVKKFRQTLRIARENMFPYEVRPIARIADYFQTVPPGLEVNFTKLEYLVLQDSVPWLNNLNLPFAETPGLLSVDFKPAFDDPVDEGFMLRTNISFKPDCSYDKPDSSRQYVTLAYNNCIFSGDSCALVVRDSVINPLGFFSNAPDLHLETNDSIVVSAGKTFELDFDLKNYVVSPAFHSWVAVISPSGNATNFEMIQIPQSQQVAKQGVIFQPGLINGFGKKSFRLSGLNIACDPDTLMLIFGWNCTPVSAAGQEACGRDTFYVELRLEKPELELDVLHEPAAIPVCDTSDWYEFEVYNAKTGFAYDLFTTVKLPPGLSVVPGSCQISYPAGNTFVPIPDPESLPGNLFQWNIAAIQAAIAANGLPGIDLDPQNALRIRFRTSSGCGFVSNTQVIYGVRGTEPCGRSTNVLNIPGDPLKINGLNPSYGVVLSLQPAGNPATFCGGVQQFSVKITLLGTPSAGDSVYVLLPQGVTYVPGSYQAVQNAPAGPPASESGLLRLPLPAGAPAGTTVEFWFSTAFDATAGCIDPIILAQTRVRTDVFCPTLEAPCTVYAATGEASWTINLQHPELELGSASAVVIDNQINTTILINNIGTVPASGVTARIWQDSDGNGIVSAGDVLLQTLENNQLLLAGGSVGMAALLNIDPSLLCNVLIELPAAENCTCADRILPLNNVTLQHKMQEYCDIQSVSIGVTAQPGFTYQWLTPNGIACASCAATSFTPTVPTMPGSLFVLILEEKSANCTVLHRFELKFGWEKGLDASVSPVCKGIPVQLEAWSPSPGATFQWSSAPGILDPSLPSQTVAPDTSSVYSVTITSSIGCTAVFSDTVEVLQPDTTHLPSLTTCQGDSVKILDKLTDVAGTYSEMKKNQSGCDSLIYQTLNVLPRPLTEESRAICSGDTLFVFDTLLTQSGQVCRPFPAANGCDSLHCINLIIWNLPAVTDPDTITGTVGQPVVLSGPAGYVAYTWIPAVPGCPNCPNATITTDSSYAEYQLIVSDANGCERLIIYRVLLSPPCDAQRLRIPNAFTPNGDGVNDVFRVVPFEGSEVVGSLTIYDRWGEKVYESQGNVSWNGTIHGKPGPSDVYVYRIDILCDGEPEAVWGDVTLLR